LMPTSRNWPDIRRWKPVGVEYFFNGNFRTPRSCPVPVRLTRRFIYKYRKKYEYQPSSTPSRILPEIREPNNWMRKELGVMKVSLIQYSKFLLVTMTLICLTFGNAVYAEQTGVKAIADAH